jgi:tetratricopeptide (TPR) repeat protein
LWFLAVGKEYGHDTAEKLDAEGDVLYSTGDFAGAKAKYEAAKAKYEEAIAAQQTLVGGVEQGVTGLLTGAGDVVDAYGAKLNAEAKSITDKSAAEVSKIKADLAYRDLVPPRKALKTTVEWLRDNPPKEDEFSSVSYAASDETIKRYKESLRSCA